MSVQIRTIGAPEVAAWVDAMRTGFLSPPAPTPAEAEFRTATFDLSHVWAAVDGTRIVGTLRSFETTVAVPGGSTVSAAALTHVTVTATHRRQGLLSAMITSDLEACAARGDAVGVLVAAEYPIYGRYGYGPAAEAVELVVDTRGLTLVDPAGRPLGPTHRSEGSVDLVDRDTFLAAAPKVYESFQSNQPGAIGRPDWWWDVTLGVVDIDGKKPPTFLALGRDVDGNPNGFVAYDVTDHWEGQRPRNTLEIHDLVGRDAAATNRLWRHCLEVDWVATVTAHDHGVADPLRWMLGDARAIRERDRADLLWLRIIDVPAALSGRRYLAPGQLVIEVDDPMGLSGGRFALEAGPDRATCTPTGEPADLALSVSTLSSAYLGGYTLADLARGGRVHELRSGTLATADSMFRSAVTPWCVTHF